MSTAATQTATQATATETSTPVKTGTNLRQRILALLAALPDGQYLTIQQIQEKLNPELATKNPEEVKRYKNVVQSTVSQMGRDGKVEKVTTQKRMPGYAVKKVVPTA